jgi:hypothetical protein
MKNGNVHPVISEGLIEFSVHKRDYLTESLIVSLGCQSSAGVGSLACVSGQSFIGETILDTGTCLSVDVLGKHPEGRSRFLWLNDMQTGSVRNAANHSRLYMSQRISVSVHGLSGTVSGYEITARSSASSTFYKDRKTSGDLTAEKLCVFVFLKLEEILRDSVHERISANLSRSHALENMEDFRRVVPLGSAVLIDPVSDRSACVFVEFNSKDHLVSVVPLGPVEIKTFWLEKFHVERDDCIRLIDYDVDKGFPVLNPFSQDKFLRNVKRIG